MSTYIAPLRDMQFVVHDLLNLQMHYRSLPDCDEVNQELIDSIPGEAGKFSGKVMASLNAVETLTRSREWTRTRSCSRRAIRNTERG